MQKQEETNRRSYIITASSYEDDPFIRGALHIEMNTENWLCDSDEAAAMDAQRDGIKLVYGIPFVEDGIYMDTLENRMILENYSRKMQAVMRKQKP